MNVRSCLVAAVGVLLPIAMLAAPVESAVTDAGLFYDVKPPAGVARAFARGFAMPISAYDDDPFVAEASVECVSDRDVLRNADGYLILGNSRVTITEEPKIYRENPDATFSPFACRNVVPQCGGGVRARDALERAGIVLTPAEIGQ